MIDKLILVLKSGTPEGARKAVETKRATGVYPAEGSQHGPSFHSTIHPQDSGVEARYHARALLWPQDHRNYVVSHTYTPGADKPHTVYSRMTDLQGRLTTNEPNPRRPEQSVSTETRRSFKTQWAAHRYLAARGIQNPHNLQAFVRSVVR